MEQKDVASLFSGIKGEVITKEPLLKVYSHDMSIFEIKPQIVIKPYDSEDVKKIVRIAKANGLSISSRGNGTAYTAGSLGKDIVLVFRQNMDKILEIAIDRINENNLFGKKVDQKESYVRVQPGIFYGQLSAELAKHGKFMPANPASGDFCTVGGMAANNSGGSRTVKYGSTNAYISSVKMVLDDGEEYEFSAIKAIDVGKLRGRFGEVNERLYRLIKNNSNVIINSVPTANKISSGYQLWRAIRDEHEFNKQNQEFYFSEIFDPLQVICGSEGTFGVITEIKFKIIDIPKERVLITSFFNSLKDAGNATVSMLKLNPSSAEFVGKHVLGIVKQSNPEVLEKAIGNLDIPQVILFTEFDEKVNENLMKAEGILKENNGFNIKSAKDPKLQEQLWDIRKKSAVLIFKLHSEKKALPFVEDACVNPTKFAEFIRAVEEIINREHTEFAVWGHAGNGDMHLHPLIDMSTKQGREEIFIIADKIYKKVKELKGSLSGEHGDGLLRTPYLKLIFGEEMVKLFEQTKKIFDPNNMFNPGKKVGTTVDDLRKILRESYG